MDTPSAAQPPVANEPVVQPASSRDDISKQTIAVLLVLVTVLSVLGTWSVLNEINKIKDFQPAPGPGASVAQGKVQFTILDPNAPIPEAQEDRSSMVTGKVTFQIKDRT